MKWGGWGLLWDMRLSPCLNILWTTVIFKGCGWNRCLSPPLLLLTLYPSLYFTFLCFSLSLVGGGSLCHPSTVTYLIICGKFLHPPPPYILPPPSVLVRIFISVSLFSLMNFLPLQTHPTHPPPPINILDLLGIPTCSMRQDGVPIK